MTTKRRSLAGLAIILSAFVLLVPAVASAQIVQVHSGPSDARQTLNFSLGYFVLKGLDSRVDDDVLLNDLQNAEPLLFEVNDFNNVTFGGEYLFGINRYLEAGVGVNYYQRTVHSIFANVTHADGGEITQDLKLRTIPMSFTARFLPIGRGSVEPYIGAGLVVIPWRYSEVGEFVDFDGTIFPARVHRRRNGGRPDDSRRRPRPGWQLRRRWRGPVAEGRGEWLARCRIPRGQAGSRRLDDELHFRVPLLTFVSAGDEANGARR